MPYHSLIHIRAVVDHRSYTAATTAIYLFTYISVGQDRTPGNCGKGLIPKIGFLSRCLLAKFVRVVPGLPYIFFTFVRVLRSGCFFAQNRPDCIVTLLVTLLLFVC